MVRAWSLAVPFSIASDRRAGQQLRYTMKLLDDIVNLLSDENGSLSDALLKTKVLMHKIGHKELADWVNDELTGYGQGKEVPAYRLVAIRVYGSVSNMAIRYPNTPLPIAGMPKEDREKWTRRTFRDSIQVLERYAANTDSLKAPIQPEFFQFFAKAGLEKSFIIERAWTQFEPNQIVHVLMEVRSRLLDFALNLQGKLGDVPENAMKEAAKEIDARGMLSRAIFGDNTTVIIGDNNSTAITNTATKGDFKALSEIFRKAGVVEADLEDLRVAVEGEDAVTVAQERRFGPKVRAWMTKMTGKAIDGTWAIGIGAGGNLLADAIGRYYGIK
jgi:hypothetical protein